jgi:hypothetical protein
MKLISFIMFQISDNAFSSEYSTYILSHSTGNNYLSDVAAGVC